MFAPRRDAHERESLSINELTIFLYQLKLLGKLISV
jgi:hypothetical protein